MQGLVIRSLVLIELAGVIILSGCSGAAQDASSLEMPLSTVEIVDMIPAGGSSAVKLRSKISVTFNTAMDARTITNQSVRVVGPHGPIDGAVTYDAATFTMTFTPVKPLEDLADFTVTVLPAVMNLQGNSLATNHQWKFSTTHMAWLVENGSLIKHSAANEEILRVDTLDCKGLSSYTPLAFDPNDASLWIADTNNDRLLKVDSEGALIFNLPQRSPQGIAVDSRDGSVWSSEFIDIASGSRLVKRSALGIRLLETASGISSSALNNAMAWSKSDNGLWVADYQTNVLKILDNVANDYNAAGPGGTSHLRIGGFLGQPFNLAYGEKGNSSYMWVADRGGAIVKLRMDGTEELRRAPSAFSQLWAVSLDSADESVWASSPDRVAKYSATGDFLLNLGGYTRIDDLAADPFDGGAWVGNTIAPEATIKLSSTGTEMWRRAGAGAHAIRLKTEATPGRRIYVDKNFASTKGDGSLENPLVTLAAGVAKARAGDTVYAFPGNYRENVTLKSNVKLAGAGPDTTIITGEGNTNVVEGLDVASTGIEGFTITGSGPTSGGLYCVNCKNIVIRNNHIVDNGNSTTSSGIVLQGSSAFVEHNYIAGNATDGIDLIGGSSSIIRNNIIAGNKDSGIYSGSGSAGNYIVNNVIDHNGNGMGGRVGILTWVNDVISNNIISNNGRDPADSNGFSVGIYVASASASLPTPVITYNDLFNNAQGPYGKGVSPGIGNVTGDPLLIGKTDYHLQDSSPIRNTGDPALPDGGVTCTDKNRASDMGAYGGPWGIW